MFLQYSSLRWLCQHGVTRVQGDSVSPGNTDIDPLVGLSTFCSPGVYETRRVGIGGIQSG